MCTKYAEREGCEACPNQTKVFASSDEAANTRTFLITEGDLPLNKGTQAGAPAAVGVYVHGGFKWNAFSGCPKR